MVCRCMEKKTLRDAHGKIKLSTAAAVSVSALCILLFAAVTCDGPVRRSLTAENSRKVKVSVLREHMAAFPEWPSGVRLSGPQGLDKGVLTDVSSRFHTDRPPQEVIEYYSSMALAQGWTPIKDQLLWEKRFCKDGVSFMIKTSRVEQGLDYEVGLTWTEQMASRSYCPQSGVGAP